MSKRGDISEEIKLYLSGKLDARAMHNLERRAQDDPFLADALEGYEKAGANQDEQLKELADRLLYRIERKDRRIIPMRVIGIAASLLLFLGMGLLWYLSHTSANREMKKQMAVQVSPVPPKSKAEPLADTVNTVAAIKENKIAALPAAKVAKPKYKSAVVPVAKSAAVAVVNAQPGYVAYAPPSASSLLFNKAAAPGANDYAVMKNQNQLAKGDSGSMLARAGINGKDYMGTPAAGQYNRLTDTSLLPGKNITGVVKAGATPLQGTIVQIKGTDIAVLTDDAGRFRFPGVPDKAILGFTHQDYVYKQAQTTNKDSLIVAMQPGNAQLSEVVVTGYGAKKQERVTGNSVLKEAAVAPAGRVVKGVVRDSSSPIPGAIVKVRGTNNQTTTDGDGNFTLHAVPDGAVISVSAIGYAPKDMPAAKQGLLTMVVYPSNNSLSEVVVTDGSDHPAPAIPYVPYPKNGWDNYNYYLKQKAISPDGKKGVVKLSFVVDKMNMISDIKVLKGISPATDSLAVKLVQDGPPWRLGSSGEPHKVKLRIRFRLSAK